MSKYCLIVSQYRHSYHTFICKVPDKLEDFKYSLLAVVQKLEQYKRDSNDTREFHYGDLEYLLDKNKEIFYSYNINDVGDIYIRIHNSINRLKDDAIYYETKAYEKDKRYITQQMRKDVEMHHCYDTIRQIIEKYFELA